jgi:transposase-like protein
MPKKTKKKRDRRVFTDEQKRAIIAEIGPKKTMAAVARKHDIHAPLLAGWRKKLADAAPASEPAPSIDAMAAAARRITNGLHAERDRALGIDTRHLAPGHAQPSVDASLEQALADIDRAGRTIAAIREAARKVFGV